VTYGSESDKFDSWTNLIFLNAKSMSCTSYSLPSRHKVRNRMSELDNFILLDIIQCIHLSGSGEMHSVSVKTGRAKGRTDSQVKM